MAEESAQSLLHSVRDGGWQAGYLFVGDQNNLRVLGYPLEAAWARGPAATVGIGQSNFTSAAVFRRCPNAMCRCKNPWGVGSDGSHFAVGGWGDTSRVLYYNSIPAGDTAGGG